MALSERGQAILDFERSWWSEPGRKELTIRERFDLSTTRYYEILNELLDAPLEKVRPRFVAIDQRDLVSARDRVLHLLRPSKAGAAEDENVEGLSGSLNGLGEAELGKRTETNGASNGGRCLEKSAATDGHRLNLRSRVGWDDSQNMTGEPGLRQPAPFMAMYGLC